MKKKRKNLVNDMKYHYTYRITNIAEKKYYYGVHSCNCLPKEDIGVKYCSSSKRPGFVQDQKENPQNYKYKIVKTFSTRLEALAHEVFLHNKFDVKLHESFYNDSNQTSTKFDTTGKGVYIGEDGNIISVTIEEAKTRNLKGSNFGKISPNKGKTMTQEQRQKSSIAHSGENNHNYGKKMPQETKDKIRNSNLGKKRSQETCENISKAQKGKIVKQETRDKLSVANKGKIFTEEHCKNISISKKGKTISDEGKANMSKGQKGKRVWNKGVIGMQTHTDKTKNIISLHFSKTKWINNTFVGKRVLEEELAHYLNDGWVLGRCKKIK